MERSKRLGAVAALCAGSGTLADIGTDHAWLPIDLVQSGRFSRAIAADINEGPLFRAEQHIRECHLEERIETRRMDGLAGLAPGEADTIVIAGMGGALTIRILSRSPKVLSEVKELILQPQSEIGTVRQWLAGNGFIIDREDMAEEAGKFYPMMHAVPGTGALPDAVEALYGPELLRLGHPVLLRYLKKEEQVKRRILTSLEKADPERKNERSREILEELERNREAQRRMGACGAPE